MGASLSFSTSVSNTSDTEAKVTVTLKVKSTSGSYNLGSCSGYITIDGTKYTFSHSFKANTTTTLATKSKTVSRTTASKSVAIKGYYKTGVSPGNISKSGTVTVSARPTYSVTFNANGGTNGKTVSVYSGYTTTFPTTSRTGYTFGSWSGYAQGATTPAITSSRTYTASWTERTATLAYNANGRGTAPSSVTMKYTAATPAAGAITASGTGYHFTKWNTQANGSGTNYAASAVVKAANVVPSAMTLYAQWALDTYTINLDPEGGTVSPTTLSKTHDSAVNLPTPTKTNNIFAGWSTLKSDDTLDINIGTICPASINGSSNGASIKLKAVWSNVVRPVYMHYFDSATNVNSIYQIVKIKDIVIDTLITPIIDNYVFDGWYKDTSFSEQITKIDNDYDFDDDESYKSDNIEPIHIYAKWIPVYTVIYNINNPSFDDGITATGSLNPVEFISGTSQNIASSSTYIYGDGQCTASGWSVNEGDNNEISTINGTRLTDNATLTLSGYAAGYVLNLYAVWTPTKYTITLNKGDSQVSGKDTIDESITYFSTYSLPFSMPQWTWSNHHLLNWTTLELGTPITVTGNATYKAQWILSYHPPVITSINTQRYLDSDYTTLNDAGKYLRITAEGIQASYDGTASNTLVYIPTYSYLVYVRFYEQEPSDDAFILTEDITAQDEKDYFKHNDTTGEFELITNPTGNPVEQKWYELTGIEPIARYRLTPTNDGYVVTEDTAPVSGKTYYLKSGNVLIPTVVEDGYNPSKEGYYEKTPFYAQWGQKKEDEFDREGKRPILDKKLKMLYCILHITDTSTYPNEFKSNDPARVFSYEFPVIFKRGIGLHIADDLSAITAFDELAEGDKGFIVTKQFSMGRAWTWTVDPDTQNLYLEWTGGN